MFNENKVEENTSDIEEETYDTATSDIEEEEDKQEMKKGFLKKMEYWGLKWDYMFETDFYHFNNEYMDFLEEKFNHLIKKAIDDDTEIKDLIKLGEWDFISEYLILSEKFIEKYTDNVNWNYISCYQVLSDEFIVKHIDKINPVRLIKEQNNLARDYDLSEDVEKLIYQKWYQKLKNEYKPKPNIGFFEHDAKTLYDLYFTIHDKPIKFGYNVLKKLENENVDGIIITVADVLSNADMYMFDDRILDYYHEIESNDFYDNPEILYNAKSEYFNNEKD